MKYNSKLGGGFEEWFMKSSVKVENGSGFE